MLAHSPEPLRKTDAEVDAYLARLDATPTLAEHTDTRRAERLPYRLRAVAAELTSFAGEVRHCLAATRNISRHGLSMLLGFFVYPGTACRIQLLSLQLLTYPAAGKVVRCRYLPGSAVLHEVGVAFERPVDVALFSRRAVTLRVLVVDDDPTLSEFLRGLLRPLNLNITHVYRGEEALNATNGVQFDYALINVELADGDGLDVVRALRQLRYDRPVIAVTAATGPEERRRCLDAGCNGCVTKPLSRAQLTRALNATTGEPALSSVVKNPELMQMVNEFVAELPAQVAALEEALHAGDTGAFSRGVRLLKERAGSYGFDTLSDVATVLEASLARRSPVEQLQRELDELARWCLTARPSPAKPK